MAPIIFEPEERLRPEGNPPAVVVERLRPEGSPEL